MPRKKKERITWYYRVSTKMQKKSFENQPIEFKELFSDMVKIGKKDLVMADKVYCDYGETGTKFNRDGFLEMLEDAGLNVTVFEGEKVQVGDDPRKKVRQIKYVTTVNPNKKPLFDTIWMKATSRFARNIEAYDFVKTLKLKGVSLWFIDIDLHSDQEDFESALRKHFENDMAYSEKGSRDQKLYQRKRKRENILSHNPPYGYKYHKRQNGKREYYTIIKGKDEIVREIFNLTLQYGETEVAKILTARGISSSKDGKSGKFSPSTVRNILNNEKYMGLNFVGKFTSGDVFHKLSSVVITEEYKDNLKEHKGLPKMVEPELWYAAQEARRSRTTEGSTGVVGARPTTATEYQKYLKCGICGNHYTYDANKGGNPHYRCSTKRNNGVEACNASNVMLYQIDSWMEQMKNGGMYEIIKSDYQNTINSLIRLLEYNLHQLLNPSSISNEEKAELQKQIEEKSLIYEEFYAKHLSTSYKSFVEKSIVDKKLAELSEELSDLEKKINSSDASDEKYIDELKKLFKITFEEIKVAEHLKKDYTEEEIFALLENIVIYGKTSNHSNRSPKISIIPTLIPFERAQGVIKAGYDKLSYRMWYDSEILTYNAEEDAWYVAREETDTDTEVEKVDFSDKSYQYYIPEDKTKDGWRLKKIAREDWTVESSVVLPIVPSDYPYNLGLEDVEVPKKSQSAKDKLQLKTKQPVISLENAIEEETAELCSDLIQQARRHVERLEKAFTDYIKSIEE